MKVKLFLPLFLLVTGLFARAEEPQSKLDASTTPKPKTGRNANPDHWDQSISQNRENLKLRVGKRDYVVSGVLVDGLRQERPSQDRSRSQKILGLPIVRLFVPQPMPVPPGSGRYFHRGKSELAWTAIAPGAAHCTREAAVTHEAEVGLISIHR